MNLMPRLSATRFTARFQQTFSLGSRQGQRSWSTSLTLAVDPTVSTRSTAVNGQHHPIIANPAHSIASLLTPSSSDTQASLAPTLDLDQVCTLAGLPYPANPEKVQADLTQFLTLVNHLHDARQQHRPLAPLESVSLCTSVSLQDLAVRQAEAQEPGPPVAKQCAGTPKAHGEHAGFEELSGLYVVPVQVVAKPSGASGQS